MKPHKEVYQPLSIGKILFYELNNPVLPIEIECLSVKAGSAFHIYTKHYNSLYNGFAISESSVAGAQFYYFFLTNGKIFTSLPMFIKNNIEVINGMPGYEYRPSSTTFVGALVGIRGIFNDITWMVVPDLISNLLTSSLRHAMRLDTSEKYSYRGKSYYRLYPYPGSGVACSDVD